MNCPGRWGIFWIFALYLTMALMGWNCTEPPDDPSPPPPQANRDYPDILNTAHFSPRLPLLHEPVTEALVSRIKTIIASDTLMTLAGQNINKDAPRLALDKLEVGRELVLALDIIGESEFVRQQFAADCRRFNDEFKIEMRNETPSCWQMLKPAMELEARGWFQQPAARNNHLALCIDNTLNVRANHYAARAPAGLLTRGDTVTVIAVATAENLALINHERYLTGWVPLTSLSFLDSSPVQLTNALQHAWKKHDYINVAYILRQLAIRQPDTDVSQFGIPPAFTDLLAKLSLYYDACSYSEQARITKVISCRLQNVIGTPVPEFIVVTADGGWEWQETKETVYYLTRDGAYTRICAYVTQGNNEEQLWKTLVSSRRGRLYLLKCIGAYDEQGNIDWSIRYGEDGPFCVYVSNGGIIERQPANDFVYREFLDVMRQRNTVSINDWITEYMRRASTITRIPTSRRQLSPAETRRRHTYANPTLDGP